MNPGRSLLFLITFLLLGAIPLLSQANPSSKKEKKKKKKKKKREPKGEAFFSKLSFKLLSPEVKKGIIEVPARGKIKVAGVIGRRQKSPKVLALFVNGQKCKIKRVDYTFIEGEEIHFFSELAVNKIKKKITVAVNFKENLWKSWKVKKKKLARREGNLRRILGPLPLSHQGEITGAHFSPGGDFLYSAGEDQKIKKWNLDTNLLVWTVEAPSPVTALKVWGKRLLAGTKEGTLLAVNESGKIEFKIGDLHKGRLNQILYSETAQGIFTAGADSKIFFLQGEKLEKKDLLLGHKGEVTALAADSKYLYSVGLDRSLRKWNLKKKKPLAVKLTSHPGEITHLALQGDWIYTGDTQGQVYRWKKKDFSGGELYRRLFRPLLVLQASSRGILIIDIRGRVTWGKKSAFQRFSLHTSLSAFAFHKNKKVFLGTDQGGGRILSLAHKLLPQLKTFHQSPSLIRRLRLSSSGNYLLAGTTRGDLFLWNLKDRAAKRTLSPAVSSIMALDIQSSHFAAATWEGKIIWGEVGSGNITSSEISSLPILYLAFTESDQLLAVNIGGQGYSVSFDSPSKKKISYQKIFSLPCRRLVHFGRSQKWMAGVDGQGRVHIRRRKGKEGYILEEIPGKALCLTIWKEEYLVLGSEKGKIYLWDLKKKKWGQKIEIPKGGDIIWLGVRKEKDLIATTERRVFLTTAKGKILLDMKAPAPIVTTDLGGGDLLLLGTFTNRIYLYRLLKILEEKKGNEKKKGSSSKKKDDSKKKSTSELLKKLRENLKK